jgi:polyhydroxyalkanoate synthesis regulator phasin
MINTTTQKSDSKQLGILLPSSNKALAEALKDASPKQLEIISKGSDLKSVINTILKEAKGSSNKLLLDLVKNNKTLKNLGNPQDTIKDLVNSIKEDKNPLPIENKLKSFLSNIKDLKPQELNQKLVSSGVKTDQGTKENIKQIVSDVLKQIQTTSSETDKKSIQLINNSPLKELSNILKSDIKSIKSLLNELKDLKPQQIEQKLSNLGVNIKELKQEALNTIDIKKDIKSIVNDVIKQIQTTTSNSDKKIVDIVKNSPLKELVQNLKTDASEAKTPQKDIRSFLIEIKDAKPEQLLQRLAKTDILTDMTSKDLKTNISNLLLQANASSMSDKQLLELVKNSVVKDLINVMNTPVSTPKEAQSIDKLLKNFLLDIKDLKPDEIKQRLANSGVFLESNVKKSINSPTALKDISTNDLKAILAKASEEITKSSHPNKPEILRNIDKLSLQIDQYQLVSYLSNSSSIFLPFSWDQMQEGNINIKNGGNGKFYCDIDLKLKDYGEVKLKLAIYDTNQLDMNVFASNKEFKDIFQENIPSLRSALIDANITPRKLRVHEPKQDKTNQTQTTSYSSGYETIDDDFKMGFRVKA